MWWASSTGNACYGTRRLISKSIRRSCDICFAQSTRREKSCARVNSGNFTTTMNLLKTPWTASNICPRGPNFLIHLIFFCMTFSFAPGSRGSSRRPFGKHQSRYFSRYITCMEKYNRTDLFSYFIHYLSYFKTDINTKIKSVVCREWNICHSFCMYPCLCNRNNITY